jgi:hypothetical protein
VTTYLVAEFARRDVKVIPGVGGDELGGYRRYLGEHYALSRPAARLRAARAARRQRGCSATATRGG